QGGSEGPDLHLSHSIDPRNRPTTSSLSRSGHNQLKQHGINHVAVVGLLADTCIEATARYAMELGYHVTLVRDATAALSPEKMHAAHDLNGPTYAHAIVTTDELTAAFKEARARS
ncbi:isochorismatase family protein, partial [Streptomyces sp. NPDC059909]|uniref:isochorismatase family protein n=1 Tax=Streptomyces sp. NPDC059909 TaxID=3346998 RepID=UPI0036535467